MRRVFFRKPEEQRLYERSRSRWEDTIKTEGVTEFVTQSTGIWRKHIYES